MKVMGLLSVNPEGHTMTPEAILPLVVHDLCYEIGGKQLLDGISFRTDAGPRTVVLGPNGAGKSLLLRFCHGLCRPRPVPSPGLGLLLKRHAAIRPWCSSVRYSSDARRRRTLPMCCAYKAYHVDSDGP